MTREGFEAWATNHHPWILADAKWHDDERRYTIMSSAQVLWEAWQAATDRQREKDAKFIRRGIFIHPEIQNAIADAILKQGEE